MVQIVKERKHKLRRAEVSPVAEHNGSKETEVPVLDAYTGLDGTGLVVWCKYCCMYHAHKWVFPGGVRKALCHNPDSPYLKSGYILFPTGRGIPASRRIQRRIAPAHRT